MPELARFKGCCQRSGCGCAVLLNVKEVGHQFPREELVADHVVEDGSKEEHVTREGRANSNGANGP